MTEEPKKISVIRDQDDELWTIEGKLDDGFQWRYPLIVKPHRTKDEPFQRWAYVHGSDYKWSPSQYAALSAILDHHDCVPSHPSGWWFTQTVLEMFATKAPGITHDFYIRWPGYEDPKFSDDPDILDVPEEPGFSAEEMKFLKHLQNVTGTQTWEALKFLWIAFRRQAIMWVARERRPLDIGFIRIVPMPYRTNWKEALAVRFSGVLSCFRTAGREKRQETLQESGFYEALASVKLLAVDRERLFCHWTLESMPSDELQEAINEQEYAKFQRSSPAGYARHMLGSMATRLNDTMRMFAKYVAVVTVPTGRKVVSDNRSGTEIIVPETRPGRVRPGRGIADVIELSPKPFARLNDENDDKPKGESAKEMLKIPDFVRDVSPFKQLPDKIESEGFQ